MERKPASKETINNLIMNAENAMADAETLLQELELVKSMLANNDLSHSYVYVLFELLSGSLMGMHEVFFDLKNMLAATDVYAKRYHMQMINLAQYELCKYLRGRDGGGILHKLMECHKNQSDDPSTVEHILAQVSALGKKCDVGLKKMTAHYDAPNVVYKKLIALNDEDVYVRRVGDQMQIHDMVLVYVSPIIQKITDALRDKYGVQTTNKTTSSLNINDLVNDKIAEALNSNEALNAVIADCIAKAWDEIDKHNSNYNWTTKRIEMCSAMQIDGVRLVEMRSIIEICWIVRYMMSDLACLMNSYLHASSNVERSICFMRAYRMEVAVLTHLYGYNEEMKQRSVWSRIKSTPEFKENTLSDKIEKKLEELCSRLDSVSRNLYTHYREDEQLNISARWKCLGEMMHPNEIIQIKTLLNLCGDIRRFGISLMYSIKSTEDKRTEEWIKFIQQIKELGIKYNKAEIVEASDKLMSLFHWPHS